MNGEVVNRIANSPIVTFKLEDIHPKGERVLIDLKEQLFHGMILREKDFRAWVKAHDWSQYAGKHVALTCSVDTIIQVWAYMLLETRLFPYAETVVVGSLEELELVLWEKALDQVNFAEFEGRPIVVKGCSEIDVPARIYTDATRRLMPYAKKISYGEPCSTVPLYRKK
ncbi:MAG: DUF2480 family protein [Bacteroidota bacterium]